MDKAYRWKLGRSTPHHKGLWAVRLMRGHAERLAIAQFERKLAQGFCNCLNQI